MSGDAKFEVLYNEEVQHLRNHVKHHIPIINTKVGTNVRTRIELGVGKTSGVEILEIWR